MATRYAKAPKWIGKDLILSIGRGDMRIGDTGTYSDPRLSKFVGMGFLVEVPEKPVAAAPAPAAAPKAERVVAPRSPAPPPVDPVTKSGNVIPGSSKRVASKDKQEPKAGGRGGKKRETAPAAEPEAQTQAVSPEDAVTQVTEEKTDGQGEGGTEAATGQDATSADGAPGAAGDGEGEGGSKQGGE